MIRALLSKPFGRALFWVMCGTVLLGALTPQADPPQLFALADKAVHTLAFVALAFVGLQAYPKHLFVVCALLIALGGLIEVVQGYTSTRSQEWEDFLADILGVFLGALLARLFPFSD
jgi:VanZ family protein